MAKGGVAWGAWERDNQSKTSVLNWMGLNFEGWGFGTVLYKVPRGTNNQMLAVLERETGLDNRL